MVATVGKLEGFLISFRENGLRSFLCLSRREGDAAATVEAALQKSLAVPLQDFYNRPRKEFRAQLVRIGFRLFADAAIEGEAREDIAAALDLAAEAIEALHTGSLIVDDIEDQSEWRRGAPTLHLRYGMPTALNAGNWLYFHAFQKLKSITFTGADATARKLLLYDLTENILREAHCGQAIDVGTDMAELSPRDCIEISRASLELKSGALMALALGLGAIIAGVNEDKLKRIVARGLDFGVSLQMFDDLGNARVDQPTPKHLEDLRLRRPSFLWWHCSEEISDELPAFNEAVGALPCTKRLADFFDRTALLQTGFQRAQDFQTRALLNFENELQPQAEAFQELKAVAERVAHAYNRT